MAPRRRQKKQSLSTSDPSTTSKRSASALAAEKSRTASREKVEKTIQGKRILCLVPDIPENHPRRDYLKFTHYVDDDDDSPQALEDFDCGTAGYLFKILQENPMMCVDFSFHQESDQGSEGDSASEDHDDSIPDEARLFQWKQSPNTKNKWTCKFTTYSSILAILCKRALGSTTTDAEHLRFISSRNSHHLPQWEILLVLLLGGDTVRAHDLVARPCHSESKCMRKFVGSYSCNFHVIKHPANWELLLECILGVGGNVVHLG